MNKRRALLWVTIALLALGGVAVLVPNSPFYLTNLFGSSGEHEGHSTRYWIKELDNSDAERRQEALYALGAIGPDAADAVPKLAQILVEHPEPRARNGAALALSKMNPASRAAVTQLGQALSDKDPLIRMNSARALFQLEADARPAVPELIKACQATDNDTNNNMFLLTVHQQMVLALGRASVDSAAGMPILTEELKNADTREKRAIAARALGLVGPEAKPAAPQLYALLKDKDRRVQEAAAEALERIEGKMPPYDVAPLENNDPRQRGGAAPRGPGGRGPGA